NPSAIYLPRCGIPQIFPAAWHCHRRRGGVRHVLGISAACAGRATGHGRRHATNFGGSFLSPTSEGGDGSTFNAELFEKFCAVYVAGLVHVAQWLAKQTAGQFALFNASTVYVATPPLRNLEYAAAKAASEACCRWLAAAYPKARVYAARFPRLNTDQTASFLSAGEHDNLETMLAELSAWLPA